MFVADSAAPLIPPASIKLTVASIVTNENGNTIITLDADDDVTLNNTNYKFIQTEDCTTNGIAVHRYGAFIVPGTVSAFDAVLDVSGVLKKATITMSSVAVGTELTFTTVINP